MDAFCLCHERRLRVDSLDARMHFLGIGGIIKPSALSLSLSLSLFLSSLVNSR